MRLALVKGLILIVFSCLLLQCKNEIEGTNVSVSEIDITNPRNGHALLSEIADYVEYIPLETTDSCLIGKISIISINSHGIFISDYRHLLHFDLKGKFINTIGSQGRGPGEFINIVDFYVDEKRSQIILMQSNSIFVYSIDGEFLWSQSTPSPHRLLSRLQNGRFVFLYDWPTFLYNDGYSLSISDSSAKYYTKALYRGWAPTSKKDLLLGSSGYCKLEYFDGELTYWENRSDTIYKISEDGQLRPTYLLIRENSPPVNATSEDIFSMKYQIISKLYESREYFFFPQVLNSPQEATSFILYKKASKEAILVQHKNSVWNDGIDYSAFLNDIDGGWYFSPKGITSSGDPYSYFYGIDLKMKLPDDFKQRRSSYNLSDKVVDMALKSKTLDNPIIMILKTDRNEEIL